MYVNTGYAYLVGIYVNSVIHIDGEKKWPIIIYYQLLNEPMNIVTQIKCENCEKNEKLLENSMKRYISKKQTKRLQGV